MATNTIPEDIIPGSLYVPDEYNFFSIDSGGLPNGDDCLIVHGDVNRRFKAFQQAPVVSPALFTNRAAVGWSMSFWIKQGQIAHVNNGLQSNHFLFGVMGRTANNKATSTNTGIIATNPGWDSAILEPIITNLLWGVVSHTTSGATPVSRIGFVRQRTYRNDSNPGGSSIYWHGLVPANTWTHVVINIPVPDAGGIPTGYINLQPITGVYDFPSYTSVPILTENMYFGLGSYSEGAQMNGRDGEWRIGKLSFHDRLLTYTDTNLLYRLMVGYA